MPKLCPCGKPLHYSDPLIQEMVESCIKELGEEIRVECNGKSYMVSRHYMALHGLMGKNLESLAEKGIVKRA